jgi:selenocysteine lyase/cysteine desulfurase
MDESYTALAGYLNVGQDEVHFGPSTSQNTYVLANALRPMWADGDEIVVSNQDHEANAGVWRRLSDRGITVREWTIDPETGLLDPDDLDDLVTNRTRMVAFPHASNVVGHINPVAEIAARAHGAGAIAVVDGVSYAPHGLPDVKALGADIYLFSMYKTWGPHLGVVTVRRELLDQMANQGHFFNATEPHKVITPAGPDHAQIAAAAGVIHYLDAVHNHHFSPANGSDEPAAAERGRRVHDMFQSHERQLLAPLLAWLRDRNDIRLIGPADPATRAPTVSVVPLDKPVAEVVRILTDHKLMIGSGDFYAVRPLAGMDVALDPGVLRMSFVHYTSPDEVDQLLTGLTHALG